MAYDDFDDKSITPTLLFTEPKTILAEADKTCPKCQGTGLVPAEGVAQVNRCICTLKSFGTKYLTPTYAESPWDKNMDVTPFSGHNLFIHSKDSSWKQLVKAYLLRTGMTLSHVTARPTHVIQSYINRSTLSTDWDALLKADLLILNTGFDPNNREYSNILCGLIEDRLSKGRHTWVVSDRLRDDKRFQDLYGFEFSNYLRRTMGEVNMNANNG